MADEALEQGWWPEPGVDYSRLTVDEETQQRWAAEGQQLELQKQAAQPVGFLRTAGDLGLGVAQGVTSLVEGAGTVYGLASGNMNNPVRTEAAAAGLKLQGAESPTLQARRALADVAVDSKEGVLAQAWEAAKQYVTDPRLLSSELSKQIAMMAPGLGLGRAVTGATGLAKAGTGTAIGTAGIQQGADVASGTFDAAIKGGAAPEAALQAAREAFMAATVTSLATATMIPGGSTIERVLAGGAKSSAGRGFAAAGARGFLGEGAQEATEEGVGQFSSNIAQARAGVEVDLLADVGKAAGIGGALGGVLGGPVGAAGYRAPPPPVEEKPVAPPADLLTPAAPVNYDVPTVFRVPDKTSVNPPISAMVTEADLDQATAPPPAPPGAPAVGPSDTAVVSPPAAAPAAPGPAAPPAEPVVTSEEVSARQMLVREGKGSPDDFRLAFDQAVNLAGGEESPAVSKKTRASLGKIAMGVFNTPGDKLAALRGAIETQRSSTNKTAVQLGGVLTKWYELATGEPYDGAPVPGNAQPVGGDVGSNATVDAPVAPGAAPAVPDAPAPAAVAGEPVTRRFQATPSEAAAQAPVQLQESAAEPAAPAAPAAPAEPVVSRKKRVVVPDPAVKRAHVAEDADANGTDPDAAEPVSGAANAGGEQPASAPGAARAGVGADVQQGAAAGAAARADAADPVRRRAAPDRDDADGAGRPAGPALADDPPIAPDRSGRHLVGSSEPRTLRNAEGKAVNASERLKLAKAVESVAGDKNAEALMPKQVRDALLKVLKNPTGDAIHKLGQAVGNLYPAKKGEDGKVVFRSHRDTGFDMANEETAVMIAEQFVDGVLRARDGESVAPVFSDFDVPQRNALLREAATEAGAARNKREERNAKDRERAARAKAEAEAKVEAQTEAAKAERLGKWKAAAAARPAETKTRLGVLTEELRDRLRIARNLVAERTLERRKPRSTTRGPDHNIYDPDTGTTMPVKGAIRFPTDRLDTDLVPFLRARFDADDLFDALKDVEVSLGGLGGVLVDQDKLDIARAKLRASGLLDENEPDLFSRRPAASPPVGKMTAAAVQKIADSISSKWSNAPGIVVVDDHSGLPNHLIAAARREGARGVFHNGKVYLVAHNLGSAAEVQFVLLHETVGHYGLRSILGDAFESTLRELAAANPGLAVEAQALQDRHGLDELLAIEEALSDMAGRGVQIGGWQKFVAAVARALRAIGLGKAADWLQEATGIEVLAGEAINALLAQSYAYVRNGHPSTMFPAATTLSRMATSPLWYSALQVALDKEPRKRGTGAEWAALFNAWVQKGIVRKEEVDWYFAGELDADIIRDETFTKEQLQHLLRSSELTLNEIHRDERGPAWVTVEETSPNGVVDAFEQANPNRAKWGPNGNGYVLSTMPHRADDNADYFELIFSLPANRIGTMFLNQTMEVHTGDAPNPVAYVRASTKTTPDGKQVLFVHEMQSDWHKPDSGAPNAPFKNTWPQLIIKRMMRYAAEQNLDGIGWASTPEQVGSIENWAMTSNEGRWEASGKDVTFVVDLYTKKLPEIFTKLSRQMNWGVKPEKLKLGTIVEPDLKVVVREGTTIGSLLDAFDLSMEDEDTNQVIEYTLEELTQRKIDAGPDVSLETIVEEMQLFRRAHLAPSGRTARDWFARQGLAVEVETKRQDEIAWYVPIADNPVLQGTVLSAQPLFSRGAVASGRPGVVDQEMRARARAAINAGKANSGDFLQRTWVSLLHLRSLADDYARELPLAPELVDQLTEKEASVTNNATEADQLVRDFERMADRELLANLLYDETTAGLWSNRPFDDQKQVPNLIKKLQAKNPQLSEADARMQLRAQQAELNRTFQRLNPQGRAMLNRIRQMMYARRQALIYGMERFITQLEPDPKARAERIAGIRKAFTYQQGPYFPLLRFGEHGLAVYDAANTLVEFTFVETAAQSEEQRARLAAEYPGHSIKQFKRSAISTELGGIRDMKFVESIRTMIGNRVADPATAAALQTAVQQLFVQSLPEFNARQRFLPRKTVPGFSRDAPRTLGTHLLSALRHESALRYNPTIQAGLQDVADFAANDPRKRRAWMLNLTLADGTKQAEVFPTRMAMYKRLGALVDARLYGAHELIELRGDDAEVRALASPAKLAADKLDAVAAAARAILDIPMPDNTSTAKVVETEIRRRIDATFNDQPNKVVSLAGNLTYVWYLGVTPAFVLANLSQNPLVTLPVLAARYGMKRAAAAMGSAAKQVGPDMVKAIKGGWRTGTFDVKALTSLPADEQRLMKYLLSRNLLDLTQSIDLGTVAEGGGAAMNAWRKAMKYGTLTGHYSEVYNRVVAALTAYRLAADREPDEAARFQYAFDVVSRTHGDYSAINRPGIMTRNQLMRLGFQFRNYAFMMTHHMIRMAKEAWKGESAEVREEARRMLMYSVGTGLLLAGARGLPFYTTFLLAAAMLGIDDPEEQMMMWVEHTTGSRAAADLLFKGLPFLMGGDMSSRIGLGSTLPFANVAEGRSTRQGESAVTGALYDIVAGPFGGIVLNASTRMPEFWSQGDLVKAVETVSPKFVRDISQAFRTGADGLTNTRGDTLIAAESVGWGDMMWKAIGVQPSDFSSVQQDRGYVIRLAKRALTERKAYLARYRSAMLAGDLDAANEVRDEVNAWNEKHPAARIKPRAFIDAVKRQSARDLMLQSTGGVAATDQEAALLRTLIDEAEQD